MVAMVSPSEFRRSKARDLRPGPGGQLLQGFAVRWRPGRPLGQCSKLYRLNRPSYIVKVATDVVFLLAK